MTLLNVIGKAMTAQIDTWSALAIGLDFMGAAAAFGGGGGGGIYSLQQPFVRSDPDELRDRQMCS